MTRGTKARRAQQREIPPPNPRIMNFAFLSAGANWMQWLADFTFVGEPQCLPVLRDENRFATFCKEYRPLNRVKLETCEEMRQRLLGATEFREAVADDSGAGIDSLARRLKDEFDLRGGPRSFVSKLAAFARPSCFVAWDRFARDGVARVLYARQRSAHTHYRCFLNDFNELWNNPDLGREFRAYVSPNLLAILPSDDAFGRRMLDVYLMTVGGRWETDLALP